jgi:hypothetical protein
MDVERTGAMDLGIGNLPLPFANFKKSECVAVAHPSCSACIMMTHCTSQGSHMRCISLNVALSLQVQLANAEAECCTSSYKHFLPIEPMSNEPMSCAVLCRAVLVCHHADKDFMVHSGFLGAYDSVKNKVFRIMDQLTATRSAEDPWTVFVTGHSLGGALATLAAYDLAGRK